MDVSQSFGLSLLLLELLAVRVELVTSRISSHERKVHEKSEITVFGHHGYGALGPSSSAQHLTIHRPTPWQVR